jgi:hypothetical protein
MLTRQGLAPRVRGLWAACVVTSARKEMRARQANALRVQGLWAWFVNPVTLQEVMRRRQGHALHVRRVRTMSLLLSAGLETPTLRLRVMAKNDICVED